MVASPEGATGDDSETTATRRSAAQAEPTAARRMRIATGSPVRPEILVMPALLPSGRSVLLGPLTLAQTDQELREVARHVGEGLPQVVPAIAAEEAHLGDTTVRRHHDGPTCLHVQERRLSLGPRLPGAVGAEEGSRRLRALAEPSDLALEPQRSLGARPPLRLGEVHDSNEEPALADPPHELRLEERRHGGGESTVTLVFDGGVGHREAVHQNDLIGREI